MTTKTLALVLTAATSSLLHASEAPPFNWSGFVGAGKTISIHGINGTIHAERGTSGSVEVSARRTSNRSDPNEVQIQVAQTGDGGVKICAVYPNNGGTDCNGQKNRSSGGRNNNDTQVHFIVKVPAQVNFTGQNVNGDVEISDILGEASAHTVNGNVKVTASEKVDAHTVNGNIVATVTGAARQAMGFHTVNGSIDLTLSSAASAQLNAHTLNGSMKTDFPIPVRGEFGNRSLSGSIGPGGGPEIKLNTVNGSVTIHKGA